MKICYVLAGLDGSVHEKLAYLLAQKCTLNVRLEAR